MKINERKLLDINVVATLFLLTTPLFGCSPARDETLEKKLTDQLILHKTDNASSMDLTKIFGDQWRKICIQEPYQTQEGFEKTTGEKVKNYPSIKDNGYALLVFYKNGDMKHLEIEEVSVMEKLSKGTACTSLNHPYFYLEPDKDGLKKYFLNEKPA